MKLLDRLIWLTVALLVMAAVLPALVAPLTTLAIVGTVCFVVVVAARYLTNRW